ncbi:MAG: NADH:flavin oxidoreductase [Synergistaceae bacterium]|nr:NADH:flavin oxidoreductase [Synergistaceae bacterium]
MTDSLLIRGKQIKNRIVMAPVYTFPFNGVSEDSFYNIEHIEHYTRRAAGGMGLIIVASTQVYGAADGTKQWTANNIAILKQIAADCHAYGTIVFMQLSCGNVDINHLSTDDIHSMQTDMKSAALSACEMGFDGVEFHFAHGFALCKFLDASFNQRNDQYGNSAMNRARILTELLPDIRSNTNVDFIISVRMGEYMPESRDGIEIARIFEKAGIDLLDISFGMESPERPVPDGFPCSSVTYSGCNIKKEVSIPVIAVGDIRTEEQIRFLIENDYVDLVAIGRGMLTDPEFANHIKNNEPIRQCWRCGGVPEKCLWFTDYHNCPAMK